MEPELPPRPRFNFALRINNVDFEAYDEHKEAIREAFASYFYQCGHDVKIIKKVEQMPSYIVITIDKDIEDLTADRYDIAGQTGIVETEAQNANKTNPELHDWGHAGEGPDLESQVETAAYDLRDGRLDLETLVRRFHTEVSELIPTKIPQVAWTGSRFVGWIVDDVELPPGNTWEELLRKLPRTYMRMACAFFRHDDEHFRKYDAIFKVNMRYLA